MLCLSMWVKPPITDVPLLDAWAYEDMNIEEKGDMIHEHTKTVP